uniref:Uncharacterized protein n=1 Tax=Corethron hystrix TaxID=216773 RepID=A0A7S1FYG9_9STRA
MSERTLSGTSRSSSDAPSFGGTPSRSSRLDVASLLPDMHPAVAARIAQGWALVPGRPGYMRPPGAAPGSSAEQYVPEAGPRGPNDRSSGNPEQGYDTPPRHGGVPDNISFTQTAENDAAGQGCAEYLAPPGVNDVALEEIFLRLEAAKSKLQECTTDDIAKQIETVELIDRLAGAAISLQKLAPPPML